MALEDKFEKAREIFASAQTAEQRRISARLWLVAAIEQEKDQIHGAGPAVALLSALEGLEFGHVDEMLRLPKGQAAGGKEAPPAQIGLEAWALALISHLMANQMRLAEAASLVAKKLGRNEDTLIGLRKRVLAERGKKRDQRKIHVSLIAEYENEFARLKAVPMSSALAELDRFSRFLGVASVNVV